MRRLPVTLLLLALPAFAEPPPSFTVASLDSPTAAAPTSPDAAAMAPYAPLAGYANGGFFMRDPNDWFVFLIRGRLQIDWYNFLNRGAPRVDPAGTIPTVPNAANDTRPKDTIFVRRARIEIAGTLAAHFDFIIGGEFSTIAGTGSYGTVADAFINVNYIPWLQLQVGQFDAPFTLENRTSDKYFDFMERSMAVRDFGVPSNREDGAMLWGYLPRKVFYYSVGVFNGDGPDLKNLDNQPAVIGRAFVAPFAPFAGHRRWMEDIWLGGSFWYQRAVNVGGQNGASVSGATTGDVAAMTTQGGYGFFSSNYNNGKDSMGNAIRTHLTPDGDIVKWAVEANVPIKRAGLRFELVGQTEGLAQYNDTNPSLAKLVRSAPILGGKLSGLGFYVEAFAWIVGDVNLLDTPGLEPFPHVKKFAPAKEPTWALMVAAKFEHLGFDVTGLPMDGAGNTRSLAGGNYQIDTIELGINAWCTKHFRLTANYVFNYLDADAGNEAANLTKNIFFRGAGEHELLFRMAIAL